MENYYLKDVVLGLRDEYQTIYRRLNLLKESLKTEYDGFLDLQGLIVKVDSKHKIGFYLPSKKGLQLLGGISSVDTANNSYLTPESFKKNECSIINDTFAIYVAEEDKQIFRDNAFEIFNNPLVSSTPIKNEEIINNRTRRLSINVDGIRLSNITQGFLDFYLEYVPSVDEIWTISEFKDTHDIYLRNQLTMEIPKEMFKPCFRKQIDQVLDKALGIYLTNECVNESRYALEREEQGFALKRVYHSKHIN